MSEPLISVITNFYNAGQFISDAIESVIIQTYYNWELILIDDGSSDDSTYIAKEYVKKFPGRILYYEHKNHNNRGTSTSRNLGIKHSSGSLITFLDADDIYLPNRLEEHLKIFNKYPEVETVFGATKYWYSWNDPKLVSKNFVQTLEISPGIYYPPKLLLLMLTKRAVVPCMGGLTIRKDVIDSVGGFVEEFTGMYDDQVLYSKLMLNSKVYIDDNFYDLYRQHNESCCSLAINSNSVLKYENMFLTWLNNYVRFKFNEYPKLIRIIKRQIALCSYPRIFTLYGRINKNKRKLIRTFTQ